MQVPILHKQYSKLNVRAKVGAKIDYYLQVIEYCRAGNGRPAIEIPDAIKKIAKLQKLADHYDEEVKAGYKHPTTRRNNKPF
jgi:hypothetical protein